MRALATGVLIGGMLALGCEPAPDAGVGAGPGDAPRTAEAERCLELVGEGRFEAAVPVCDEALRLSPGDPELSDALEQARVAVETGAAEARAAAEEAARTAR